MLLICEFLESIKEFYDCLSSISLFLILHGLTYMYTSILCPLTDDVEDVDLDSETENEETTVPEV